MGGSERYKIVWQECGKNSRAAERFYVPEFEGYLPFFLWGEDLNLLESKQQVELREEQLLKGILYGMYELDHHPLPIVQKKDKETYLQLIDILGDGFRYENSEKMILDVACNVREKNGNAASRVILEVGKSLVPKSSQIKSDLIFDLWEVICEQKLNNTLLEEILLLIRQIELNQIHPNAKESVCYYGLCSLVLLKMEKEISSYLSEYIYPNIEARFLKNRIKALLENPSGFNPIDLKLT